MRWVVVTPNNIDQVWAELEKNKTDLVLFSLTDDGYEQLAITMLELRQYIEQQKAMLIKYKEYYEPQEKQQTK